MQIVTLKPGRSPGTYRQVQTQDVQRDEALRQMADRRAAIAVVADEATEGEPQHLFVTKPCLLSFRRPASTRSRLHSFAALEEHSFEGGELLLAEQLLELGCAVRSLPSPSRWDTLVRFTAPTPAAGLEMPPGAVAAVDFDPTSVIPELRDLGLFPWQVMPIEDRGPRRVQGREIDSLRLVVYLEQPWQPVAAGAFLAGTRVDLCYRDYRRQIPVGQVERAYQSAEASPPFGVLGR